MVQVKSLQYKSKDNLNFFARKWIPNKIEAVVCLVHGLGEHCGRYHHVAEFLAQNNIATLAYDQRGHGKSEGPRGHTPNYAMLMHDVTYLLNKKNELFDASIPTILYGHSFGANMVSNYILAYKPNVKAAVLSSALFSPAFEAPKWKVFMGNMMNKIYGAYTERSGLPAEKISRIKEEVEKYKKDPLIHDYVSARMFVDFSDAGKWAINNAHKLEIPTLVMHGSGDGVTDHKKSIEFVEKAGKNAHLKIWENGFHELHYDIGSEQFLNYLLTWIEKQL